MDLGLKGKRALVCGANRGLGFACAESLAKEGVSLALVARDVSQLETAARQLIAEYGLEVTCIRADLSTSEGCAEVIRTFQNPDILVTNCGGAPPGNFLSFSREDWISALELNMLSALDLIRGTVGGMRSRGFGRIVSIANVALRDGYPDLPLSAGATGGLTAAMASLAYEMAPHGVTINTILPGRFATERLARNMAFDVDKTGVTPDEIRTRRLARQAVQRFGDPSELGDLCAFLCGRNAGYIIGQTIAIDGAAFSYSV